MSSSLIELSFPILYSVFNERLKRKEHLLGALFFFIKPAGLVYHPPNGGISSIPQGWHIITPSGVYGIRVKDAVWNRSAKRIAWHPF